MNETNLKKKLNSVGALLRNRPSLTDRIMTEINQRDIEPTPWSLRVFLRPEISVSFAGVILVVMLVFVFSGPRSLCAQVNRALLSARSVHIVGQTMRDGNLVPAYEVWYMRDTGVIEQSNKRMRIDNGHYQWMIDESKRRVIKKASEDAFGVVGKLLSGEEFEHLLAGESKGATEINGVPCRVYSDFYLDGTSKMEVWIDERNRAHGYRETRLNDEGHWIISELSSIYYNVDIDPARFTPQFSDDYTIKDLTPPVDGGRSLSERYQLDTALFSQETMGLIFAVHRITRCDDDMVYVVASIRPTETTINELGAIVTEPGKYSHLYGDFNFYHKGKQLENGTWQSIQSWCVADMRDHGLAVHHEIHLLQGEWPDSLTEFDISPTIHTRWKLREKWESEGKEPYHRYQPMTTMELPDERIPFEEALKEIYTEAEALQPISSYIILKHGLTPDPEKKDMRNVHTDHPSNIDLEDFIRASKVLFERFRDQ